MLNGALQVPSTVVSGMHMNREGELLLAFHHSFVGGHQHPKTWGAE